MISFRIWESVVFDSHFMRIGLFRILHFQSKWNQIKTFFVSIFSELRLNSSDIFKINAPKIEFRLTIYIFCFSLEKEKKKLSRYFLLPRKWFAFERWRIEKKAPNNFVYNAFFYTEKVVHQTHYCYLIDTMYEFSPFEAEYFCTSEQRYHVKWKQAEI